MGVARVSIPVASILVAHRALKRVLRGAARVADGAARRARRTGSRSSREYTEFVGLKEYRALKNEYLPRATVEEKYAVTLAAEVEQPWA